MKILAFSDLHASSTRAEKLVEASASADLVIGAGDFCNARRGLEDALWLLAGLKAPMIAVAGNAESADELRDAALPDTTVLHGDATEIDGISIFGFGGAVPETPFGDWSWDISENDAALGLAHCCMVDILITHSPPKGIADKTSSGDSVGSRSIFDAIGRLRPRLALCGHIHDSWGVEGRLGPSRIVNLGPGVNWFEI